MSDEPMWTVPAIVKEYGITSSKIYNALYTHELKALPRQLKVPIQIADGELKRWLAAIEAVQEAKRCLKRVG